MSSKSSNPKTSGVHPDEPTTLSSSQESSTQNGDTQTASQKKFNFFKALEARRDKRARRKKRKEERKEQRKKDKKPPTNFKRELFTIPNILCYFRIILIPVVLVYAAEDTRWSSFLAAVLFTVASVTDFFDGFLARKLNQITILGKLLDPLADKLIVASTLILMIPLGRVPGWLVLVLLAREFTITGLRGIAASEGMVIAASSLGKYKTVFQMLSIFCLLIHYPYQINYFNLFQVQISFQQVGMAFLYIALFYSLLSAFEYFWKFAAQINDRQEESAS
jgi:CDP-diacylglycerol--glycerol-3-phosphate 3-phosphatidyltransferase